MSTSLPSDIASSLPRPLLERTLIGVAHRLGAVGVLLLVAGLGAAYASGEPAGGGSKVLVFALVPFLLALAASLWANALRRRHGEPAQWGLTAVNLVLLALVVTALVLDQTGYIAAWSAEVKQWMDQPAAPTARRRRRAG